MGDLKEKNYSAFHVDASAILGSWTPKEDYKEPQVVTKMSRDEPEVVSSGDDAPAASAPKRLKRLPKYYSQVLQAIQVHRNNEPTEIPFQSGAQCAMHAVNNLLGTDFRQPPFDINNFRLICRRGWEFGGSDEWWEDDDIQIILGANREPNADRTRYVVSTTRLNLGISRSDLDFVNLKSVLDDSGLVGIIFYLGSTNGHWTALKKWKRDGNDHFTYMDSFRKGPNGGFIHKENLDGMATFLLYDEKATYAGIRWSIIYPLFESENACKTFRTKWKNRVTPGSTKPRRTGSRGDGEEDDDLSKLMAVYMSIMVPNVQYTVLHPGYQTWKKTISGQLPRIWRKIAEIIKDENPDDSTTIEELAETITNSSLEVKIKCLTKFLGNPADS